MKKVNGKSYNDLSLYFKPENQNESNAYIFLTLLGRRKTTFVSELIVKYLNSVGIADATRLTPEYAKLIASDSFMASATSTTMSMGPLLKLFEEQLSQKETQETEEPPMQSVERKRVPPKRKSTKSDEDTEKKISNNTPIPKDVISESDDDDDDLLDDDFIMDANIMQGLSAFGIPTQ